MNLSLLARQTHPILTTHPAQVSAPSRFTGCTYASQPQAVPPLLLCHGSIDLHPQPPRQLASRPNPWPACPLLDTPFPNPPERLVFYSNRTSYYGVRSHARRPAVASRSHVCTCLWIWLGKPFCTLQSQWRPSTAPYPPPHTATWPAASAHDV
jgi:hypothetical protein